MDNVVYVDYSHTTQATTTQTTVGYIVDVMFDGAKITVNDQTTYSLVETKVNGESVVQLCNYENDNVKYFINVDLNSFIKIFKGQIVKIDLSESD